MARLANRCLEWFGTLPLIRKIGVIAGSSGLGAVALGWRWGWKGILLALGVILVIVLLLWGFDRFLRASGRKKARRLNEDLVNNIRRARAAAGEQFVHALRDLKQQGVDIYQLPWFFFVGEPGGGKTFTIKRSGVDLPLGTEGVSTGRHTADIDFWFTNEAVIVDTAGRLTVLENEVVDREEWNEILALLVRYRAHCPINGVLVGVPCTSLLGDDEATRKEKATRLRDRLRELQSALKIRFPVYFVILKTDLVLGFEPFFRRLPVLERKQILGWSQSSRFDLPYDASGFDHAFEKVCLNLRRLRLKYLEDEETPEKLDDLYVFPEEFRALRAPLKDYVATVFTTGPYGQAGFFRGFYFTSSLQEGRAIPQAIRDLLGPIGDRLERESQEDLAEIEAHSSAYFVRDLYTRKVFPEKGLVLRTDRSKWLNAFLRGAALWGGIAVTVIGLLVLGVNFFLARSGLQKPWEDVRAVVVKSGGTEEPSQPSSLQPYETLGRDIERWREEAKGSPGFFQRLGSYLRRSPTGDEDLLEKLEEIHNASFGIYYLRPRISELLGANHGAGAGTATQAKISTWQEFEQRRDEIIAVAGLKKENASPAGPGARGTPKETTLFSEDGQADRKEVYRRFLRFKGDPTRFREEREGQSYEKRLENAVEPLASFLRNTHQPVPLDTGGGAERRKSSERYGCGIGDEFRWWRRVLWRGEQLRDRYNRFLGSGSGSGSGSGTGSGSGSGNGNGENKPPEPKELLTAFANFIAAAKSDESRRSLEECLSAQEKEIKKLIDSLRSAPGGSGEAAGLGKLLDSLEKELLGEGNPPGALSALKDSLAKSYDSLRSLFKSAEPATGNGDGATPAPAGPAAIVEKIRKSLSILVCLENWNDGGTGSGSGNGSTCLKFDLDSSYKNGKPFRGIHERLKNAEAALFKPLKSSKDPEFWRLEALRARVGGRAKAPLEKALNSVMTEVLKLAVKPPAAGDDSTHKPPGFDQWYRTSFDSEGVYNTKSARSLLADVRSLEAYLSSSWSFPDSETKASETKASETKHSEAKPPPGTEKSPSGGGETSGEGVKLDLKLEKTLWGLLKRYRQRYLNDWEKRTGGNVKSLAEVAKKRAWSEWRESFNEKLGKAGRISFFSNLTGLKKALEPLRSWPKRSGESGGEAPPLPDWANGLPDDDNTGGLKSALVTLAEFLASEDASSPVMAMTTLCGKPKTWSLTGLDSHTRWRFGKELFDLSAKGRELLLSACEEQFFHAWNETVKNKFAESVKAPEAEGLRFPFVRKAEFHFENDCQYLSDENYWIEVGRRDDPLAEGGALTGLLSRFKPCLARTKDNFGLFPPGGEEHKKTVREFLDACRRLQSFLYEIPEEAGASDGGHWKPRTIEVQIKGVGGLPPGLSKREFVRYDSGSLADSLVVEFASMVNRVTLSATRPDERKTLTWSMKAGAMRCSPQKGGESLKLTLEDPQGRADMVCGPAPASVKTPASEEGPVSLTLEAKGPWSLLLFLWAYGKPEDSENSYEIRKVFPKMRTLRAGVKHIVLRFELTLDGKKGAGGEKGGVRSPFPLPDWSAMDSAVTALSGSEGKGAAASPVPGGR